MRAKCGRVALVGRPNAGKSTLMNRFLAETLAIVSDKPQTTRHRLVGILTEARGQMVFLDTPGIHKPQHRLNRRMVRAALSALEEADVICLLVDAAAPFGGGDRFLLDLLGKVGGPKVAALNKIDRVRKPRLLPLIQTYAETGQFDEIVPVSALDGDGTDRLKEILWRLLPEGEYFYDPELLTIHPERFLVAERIRAKVLEQTRQELPFATAVLVERWQEEGALLRLYASILVERPGQKKILVGKQGNRIKAIGTAARLDLEDYLGRKVYLELHVRVEPGWRESRRLLGELELELEARVSPTRPD